MQLNGTIQERAYYTLRKNILDLVLEPGMAMTIQEIADEMGVSRTPVREALIRLQKDALVSFLPQRETVVTRIDLQRVQQERFMRENLETVVVELFMERHSPEAVLTLNALIEQQKLAIETGDYAKLLQYDDEFHKVFYENAGQQLSWEMLEQLNTHYRRVRLLNIRNGKAESTVFEHQELLHAVRGTDRAKVKNLLRQHLHKLDSEIEHLREAYPSYFVIPQKAGKLLQLY